MPVTPDNPAMSAAMSPQERMAREYLAQGRFRKARDEFKQLCKLDRPRFLPLLVEANMGLARELSGKGMQSEARQVIAYLHTIASPEQVLALELELGLQPAAAVGPGGAAAPGLLDLLATTALGEAERQRLADRAVVAFEPLPHTRPEAAALAAELEAIGTALRALSERRFEQALDLVRPVGQSSVFAHWKGWIKGLCAFHSGEAEKAARFLAALPAGSVPGKASQAYLLLLGKVPLTPEAPLPAEAVVEAACRLLGESGSGGPLLRAEQAWRKHDPTRMYQSLRTGLRRFPAEGADLPGLLSEFATNCLFTLPFEVRDRYLDLVEDIVDGIRSTTPVEQALFLRAAVVADFPSMPDALAIRYWEDFLRLRAQLHGPRNPALEAVAYAWLGKIMSEPPDLGSNPLFAPVRHRKMRNGPEAQRLLEKALALDPNHLPAGLQLCEVLKQLRRHAQRNRLLDQLSARFPTDKNVLLLAGQTCLERKAYKKGLDYLLQVMAIDRLDPAVPNQLVRAYLLQARDYFQKRRPDNGRKALEQAAAFAVDTPDNLARARWCLKIHRGLLEWVWGDPARGDALLDEARRESPSEAAFLFFAGLVQQAFEAVGLRGRDYYADLGRLAKTSATAAQALLLTRIWQYAREWIPERVQYLPRRYLGRYLRATIKRPFTREEVTPLVEFAQDERDYEFMGSIEALVKKQLKRDAQDPLFRLHRFRLERSPFDFDLEADCAELEAMLAEATRRKDEVTARQIRKELEVLKRTPPPPFPFGGDAPFEEEEDFGPEDLPELGGGELPTLDELLGSLPAGERELMAGMLDMLANASDAELKQLRRTMPPSMSGLEFEMLVALARATRSLPHGSLPRVSLPKPPPFNPFKGPKPPKPPKPTSDPNQSDLF